MFHSCVASSSSKTWAVGVDLRARASSCARGGNSAAGVDGDSSESFSAGRRGTLRGKLSAEMRRAFCIRGVFVTALEKMEDAQQDERERERPFCARSSLHELTRPPPPRVATDVDVEGPWTRARGAAGCEGPRGADSTRHLYDRPTDEGAHAVEESANSRMGAGSADAGADIGARLAREIGVLVMRTRARRRRAVGRLLLRRLDEHDEPIGAESTARPRTLPHEDRAARRGRRDAHNDALPRPAPGRTAAEPRASARRRPARAGPPTLSADLSRASFARRCSRSASLKKCSSAHPTLSARRSCGAQTSPEGPRRTD